MSWPARFLNASGRFKNTLLFRSWSDSASQALGRRLRWPRGRAASGLAAQSCAKSENWATIPLSPRSSSISSHRLRMRSIRLRKERDRFLVRDLSHRSLADKHPTDLTGSLRNQFRKQPLALFRNNRVLPPFGLERVDQ